MRQHRGCGELRTHAQEGKIELPRKDGREKSDPHRPISVQDGTSLLSEVDFVSIMFHQRIPVLSHDPHVIPRCKAHTSRCRKLGAWFAFRGKTSTGARLTIYPQERHNKIHACVF